MGYITLSVRQLMYTILMISEITFLMTRYRVS